MVMKMQVFEGITNPFQFKEIITKAQKRYIVSGYISTKDVDLVGDQVTSECLQDMLAQIQSGSVKMDWEHETIIQEDLNKVPRAKIIPESAMVDGKGLWVEAEINPNHADFNELWGSIKDKFLDAFSIAFRPVEAVVKWMGDKAIRILNKVKLINVGITGNPVNEEAKMNKVVIKALTAMGSGLLGPKKEPDYSEEIKEVDRVIEKGKKIIKKLKEEPEKVFPYKGELKEPVEKKALTYEGTQVYAGEKSNMDYVAGKFSKTYDLPKDLLIEGMKEEMVHLGTVNNDVDTIAKMACTRLLADSEHYSKLKTIENRESYSTEDETEGKTEVTELVMPDEESKAEGTEMEETKTKQKPEDETKPMANKEDYKSDIAQIKSDIENLKSELESIKAMHGKEKEKKQYGKEEEPEKKSVMSEIKSLKEEVENLRSLPVLKSRLSEVPTELNKGKELPSSIVGLIK